MFGMSQTESIKFVLTFPPYCREIFMRMLRRGDDSSANETWKIKIKGMYLLLLSTDY